jgi:hypothetical protein
LDTVLFAGRVSSRVGGAVIATPAPIVYCACTAFAVPEQRLPLYVVTTTV